MSLFPIFQNRKRETTVSVGCVTTDGVQEAPAQNACARFASWMPSGAAVFPEPGSNDSWLPQSTVREKITDDVAPPVVAPPGSVQRSRTGGPGSGSHRGSG